MFPALGFVHDIFSFRHTFEDKTKENSGYCFHHKVLFLKQYRIGKDLLHKSFGTLGRNALCSPEFGNKPIHQLVPYMNINNVDIIKSGTYKLTSLILSILALIASVE